MCGTGADGRMVAIASRTLNSSASFGELYGWRKNLKSLNYDLKMQLCSRQLPESLLTFYEFYCVFVHDSCSRQYTAERT